MSRVALFSGVTATTPTAATKNQGPTGRVLSVGFTGEALAQMVTRAAGLFSRLAYQANAAPPGGAVPITITFRVNGVNGNQVVTNPGGATGIFRSLLKDKIVSGDKINFQWGTNEPNVSWISVDFEAASGYSAPRAAQQNSPVGSATASTTWWIRLVGLLGPLDITANAEILKFQQFCRAPATIRNFYAEIGTNARTTATVLRVRKNAANGNGVLSVGASATGLFEDVVNTDAVVSGDSFNGSVTNGTGVGICSLASLGATFDYTGGKHDFGSGYQGEALPTTNPSFMSPITPAFDAVEGNQAITPTGGGIWSNARVRVSTVGSAATVTLRSRINGVNGNQVITHAAATAGLYEDVTNSDVFGGGSALSLSWTPSVTPTTFPSYSYVDGTIVPSAAPRGLIPVF